MAWLGLGVKVDRPRDSRQDAVLGGPLDAEDLTPFAIDGHRDLGRIVVGIQDHQQPVGIVFTHKRHDILFVVGQDGLDGSSTQGGEVVSKDTAAW